MCCLFAFVVLTQCLQYLEWWLRLQSLHLGGWKKRITTQLRPEWGTWEAPDFLELQDETLPQTHRKSPGFPLGPADLYSYLLLGMGIPSGYHHTHSLLQIVSATVVNQGGWFLRFTQFCQTLSKLIYFHVWVFSYICFKNLPTRYLPGICSMAALASIVWVNQVCFVCTFLSLYMSSATFCLYGAHH